MASSRLSWMQSHSTTPITLSWNGRSITSVVEEGGEDGVGWMEHIITTSTDG